MWTRAGCDCLFWLTGMCGGAVAVLVLISHRRRVSEPHHLRTKCWSGSGIGAKWPRCAGAATRTSTAHMRKRLDITEAIASKFYLDFNSAPATLVNCLITRIDPANGKQEVSTNGTQFHGAWPPRLSNRWGGHYYLANSSPYRGVGKHQPHRGLAAGPRERNHLAAHCLRPTPPYQPPPPVPRRSRDNAGYD